MTRHQEQNAVNREQFGKQAPAYARLTREAGSDAFAWLISALAVTSSDRVLDVGCGPGRMTLALARVAAQATGIDLTPEMLEQARAAQAEQKVANVDWRLGDTLPLPFADGSFSIVVTQATFHHLADPQAVLAEMARVCAPGGRIAVIDMTPDAAKAAAFDQVERLRDPSHVRTLTLDELRGLGRDLPLEETAFRQTATSLSAEMVLTSSCPPPENLERVRALYREDAASGADRLGMRLREENGQLLATYPMSSVVWRRT